MLKEAGVSSTLEPLVGSMFSGAGAAGRNMQAGAAEALRARRAARATRAGAARGDVLCVMDRALHLIDVVWVHPAGRAQRRAASRSAGAAAQDADGRKRTQYRRLVGLDGYKLVPFSVETHGRLGRPAMQLLNKLGHLAEQRSRGLLRHAQFVERALQRFAVLGVQWNARMETHTAGDLALSPGREYLPGDAVPPADVGEE